MYFQAPQTYPVNMNPVAYSDEDQTNNGQCNKQATDGNIIVKRQDMAKTGNAVKNDLIKKILKLNLSDNTKSQTTSKAPESTDIKNKTNQSDSNPSEDEESGVDNLSGSYNSEQLLNAGKKFVSEDSGLGEFELSLSSEGSSTEADQSILSGNDSADNLDSPSDSSSQSSVSSATSETYVSRDCFCHLHHLQQMQNKNIMLTTNSVRPADLKVPQQTLSTNNIQPMKPIPLRFKFMLDEEARKNPSQHPKRFEGQPLVRHKPLGNRKRKLARLAHIAYMMELGSEKAKTFEFNPDAECFQPRQNIGPVEGTDSKNHDDQYCNNNNTGKISPVVKTSKIENVVDKSNTKPQSSDQTATSETVSTSGEAVVKTDNVNSENNTTNSAKNSNDSIVKANVSPQLNMNGDATKTVVNNNPVIHHNDINSVQTAVDRNVLQPPERSVSYVTYLVPGQTNNRNVCPSYCSVSSADSTGQVVEYQTSVNQWNNEINNNNIISNQSAVVYNNVVTHVDNGNYEQVFSCNTYSPTSPTGCGVPASPVTPTACPMAPPPAPPAMVINSPVLMSFPPLPPPLPPQTAVPQQPAVVAATGQHPPPQQQAVTANQPMVAAGTPQQAPAVMSVPASPDSSMVSLQNQAQQTGQVLAPQAMPPPVPIPTGTVYYNNMYQPPVTVPPPPPHPQVLSAPAYNIPQYSTAQPTTLCEPLQYATLPAEQPHYY